jgi:glycosyltransferase involved in cell wall biosynthesis
MYIQEDRNKGLHFLREALPILQKHFQWDQYELLLFDAAHPSSNQYIAPHIRFLGKVSEKDLPLYYSAADVFILPSIQDNLPNVIVESMACETPVVAFNVCGAAEIIQHRQSGYLAKPFDLQDLANGIDWVVKNSLKLKEGLRQMVLDEFSYKAVSEKYINLYKNLL